MPGATDRTRVRRLPEKAVTDAEVLHAVLDAGLVAHVAVVDDGQPFVIPVAYARRHDEVLFHGSTGSRLFRTLAAGQPTCLTVTLLDGLVLARSAFESSMNYRSAMVIGVAQTLEGDDELDALRTITEPAREIDVVHETEVLVVGSGNTGMEIATDLADHGATRVWLAVRTPPHILPRSRMGWPAQGTGILVRRLPPRLVDRVAAVLAVVQEPDLTDYGLPRPEADLYSRVLVGRVPVQDVGIVDARFIWYTAVIAVVTGHVLGVYLAHATATRLFGNGPRAARSQYPMLVLMVGYTIFRMIDHMARPDPVRGDDDPNLRKMLELLSKGNFWVMLSLGEKTSKKGKPWDDVIPIARANHRGRPIVVDVRAGPHLGHTGHFMHAPRGWCRAAGRKSASPPPRSRAGGCSRSTGCRGCCPG